MSKKKFYAVKKGRIPGIYYEWSECQQQVIRFKGQDYGGFETLEEAEAYLQDIPVVSCEAPILTPEGKHYDIFTDGSFEKKSLFDEGRYSWAFAVYEGDKLVIAKSDEGTDKESLKYRNIAGELEAVVNAVSWAEGQNASITIHHDYTGIAHWASGAWKAKNELTQRYLEFIKTRLGWVKFNKVSAHSGIKGNELVDKLAGEILRTPKAV